MLTQETPTHNRQKPDRRSRQATDGQRLLTGQQIEALYGPPYRTVYDWHLRGDLPAVRFPGSRRLWFRREDIESLIQRSLQHV